MSTRITINGEPVEEGRVEEALAQATAERYIAVKDGAPVDLVMWDGVTTFEHPDGAELVREADWQGQSYQGPPEPADVRAKRTTAERLDRLVTNLRDDLKAFDTMTAAQRQRSQERTLRGVLLLARVIRDDHTGDVE